MLNASYSGIIFYYTSRILASVCNINKKTAAHWMDQQREVIVKYYSRFGIKPIFFFICCRLEKLCQFQHESESK